MIISGPKYELVTSKLTVWEMKVLPVEFTAFNRSWFSLLMKASSLQAGSKRKQTRENIRGVTTCQEKIVKMS